jgi:hypothetical protein
MLEPISALEGMQDAVSFTLLPSGNARMVGGKIQCQHGPQECTGNAWENCVKSMVKDKFSSYSPFIFCMEGNGDDMLDTSKLKKCVEKANLKFSAVQACATGSRGDALNRVAFNATGAHEYVPWFRINGKHVSAAENSKSAMLKAICQTIKGKKPSACSGSTDQVLERCFNTEKALA